MAKVSDDDMALMGRLLGRGEAGEKGAARIAALLDTINEIESKLDAVTKERDEHGKAIGALSKALNSPALGFDDETSLSQAVVNFALLQLENYKEGWNKCDDAWGKEVAELESRLDSALQNGRLREIARANAVRECAELSLRLQAISEYAVHSTGCMEYPLNADGSRPHCTCGLDQLRVVEKPVQKCAAPLSSSRTKNCILPSGHAGDHEFSTAPE